VAAEIGSIRADPVAPRRAYARRFRSASSADEATIVATVGDRVIGSVGLVREPRGPTRHVASLVIAVEPTHRGRGVGSSLLDAAVAWARSQGVAKLLLSVYPDNTPAISLYRRFGFVEEGRLSRQSSSAYGYRDEILMAAWIGAEDV
jgi:ribosomal protein S18 acetylase RimI-like enzyme